MDTTRCIRTGVFALALLAPWGALPALEEADPSVSAVIEDITAESLLSHVDTLVSFGTRRWDQPGGRAAQEYIEDFFSGLPLDDVYLHDFDSGSDNVVGVFLGRERPERIHIIGAHYDSISADGPAEPAPGADDNASGTAAVLEAARAITTSGKRPAETIIFVAFSKEEVGLQGSRAFASVMVDQGATVADMIAVDVIGYVEPGTDPDLSVSSTSSTPQIDLLIERLGEVVAAYLPGWRFEWGSDCG